MANGFVFTEGLSDSRRNQPASTTAQLAAQTPNIILRSAALAENKKREAQRQFERAQNMMREDLNTVAAFDVTSAGLGQYAQGLTDLAQYTRNEIKKVNNPVEAQELISNFSRQYNMAKQRQEVAADAIEFHETIAKATGEELDNFNSSLDLNLEYIPPTANDQAIALSNWSNPYASEIKIVDGQMMAVDPADGQLKMLADIEKTLDISMWEVGTREIRAGSLRDWAASPAVKTDIGFKDGTWSASRAGQIYDENILQTGRKEDKSNMGETHRRQVLNTLEQVGLIDIFDNEERRLFVLADADFMEEAKTQKVLALGREEFIKLSRFDADALLTMSGRKTKDGEDELAGYGKRGLTALAQPVVGYTLDPPDTLTLPSDIPRGGEVFATQETYDLISIPEPIEIEGSENALGGDYTIYGFGVDPQTLNPTARIQRATKVTQYEYNDEANQQKFADSLAEAERLNDPNFPIVGARKTRQITVTEEPETLEIGSDLEGINREVFNMLFANNEIAYNILLAEIQQANAKLLQEALQEAR